MLSSFLMVIIASGVVSIGKAAKEPTLIWTSLNETDGRPNIFLLEADPDEWIPRMKADENETLQIKYMTGGPDVHDFHGLAVDTYNDLLFLSNVKEDARFLIMLNLKAGTIAPIHGAISAEVNGLAHDWVHNTVYWTDSLYNHIGLMSLTKDKNGRYNSKIILHTYMDAPHGIAVHPGKGAIYWTDEEKSTLETASLSGRNRTVLVQLNETSKPTSLHLDIKRDKLYFIESETDEIYRCDVDGQNLEQVTVHNISRYHHLRGIALYNDYLFSCDEINHKILIWNLTAGLLEENLLRLGDASGNKYGEVRDLIMLNEDDQPSIDSPCHYIFCGDLCVAEWYNETDMYANCMCPTNTIRNAENGDCEVMSVANPPLFMVYDHSMICIFDHMSPNTHDRFIQKSCTHFTGGRENPIASYYNGSHGFLYDVLSNKILRLNLIDDFPNDDIASSVKSLSGIAVDWLHDKLYYLSSEERNLMVANENGTGQVELVADLGGKPEGLVVDPLQRKMYLFLLLGKTWILQSRNLDGSDPTTILSEGFVKPRRITYDIMGNNRLYWTDQEKGTIESCEPDGSKRTVVFMDLNAEPFGIGIFRDYIFWSDIGKKNVGIFWSLKTTGEIVKRYSSPYTLHEPGDVSVYEDYKHLTIHGMDPCLADNGGCQHICLALSETDRVCKCSWGYTLENDNVSCATYTSTGNFLLVTGSHTGGVFQLDLDPQQMAQGTRALPVPVDDVPVGLALDPNVNTLFISSVHPFKGGKVTLKTFNFTSLEHKEYPSTFRPDDMPRSMTLDTKRKIIFVSDPEEAQVLMMDYKGEIKGRVNPWRYRFDSPWSIAYDEKDHWLYWSSSGIFDRKPHIVRMNMTYLDHSNDEQVEMIIDTDHSTIKCPNSIAIDQKTRKLFWADCVLGKVEMCDLDGSNRVIVLQKNDSFWQTMTLDDEYIYLADWIHRDIQRFNRVTKSFETPLEVGYSRINELLVFRGQLKIPEPTTQIPETTQGSITTNPVFDEIATAQSQQVISKKDSVPIIIGVVIAAIVLIGAIIVIVLIVRRRRGKRPVPSVLFSSAGTEEDGTLAVQAEIGAYENHLYDVLPK